MKTREELIKEGDSLSFKQAKEHLNRIEELGGIEDVLDSVGEYDLTEWLRKEYIVGFTAAVDLCAENEAELIEKLNRHEEDLAKSKTEGHLSEYGEGALETIRMIKREVLNERTRK